MKSTLGARSGFRLRRGAARGRPWSSPWQAMEQSRAFLPLNGSDCHQITSTKLAFFHESFPASMKGKFCCLALSPPCGLFRRGFFSLSARNDAVQPAADGCHRIAVARSGFGGSPTATSRFVPMLRARAVAIAERTDESPPLPPAARASGRAHRCRTLRCWRLGVVAPAESPRQ